MKPQLHCLGLVLKYVVTRQQSQALPKDRSTLAAKSVTGIASATAEQEGFSCGMKSYSLFTE